MIEIPEPVDGVDFYSDEVRRYTVTIEVEVDGLHETDGEEEAQWRAVDGFRDGSLDGDATVMHSEKVSDVELDFKTDLPFNRDAWRKAKLLELGINEHGDPLRPGEKERPECEMTLDDFIDEHGSVFARIVNRIDAWCIRCKRAFSEAF